MSTEATTINRKLHTHILKDQANIRNAVDVLAGLPGMLEVGTDTAGKHLRVRYDTMEIQFPALIRALKSHGLMTEAGWWDRLKFSLYGFTDTNTRDNATAKSSPCCSNPEGITGSCGKKGCH